MSIQPIEIVEELINILPDSSIKADLLKEVRVVQEETLRIEAESIKIHKALERLVGNEKRFINSVSHELLTPLSVMLGYTALLDETALSNKQKKYLHKIIQSSDHLTSLMSDVFDMAKFEDNSIALSLSEFDLDDTLNECARLMKSKISDKIHFIVDIPLLDYSVISDSKRVKQIFTNLLSHAVKCTKKGSIHFYVKEVKELENNKVKITINVDDTGNGIPKKRLKMLFEPFDSTDSTEDTGLGLYISQQLAHLMDGDIVVDTTTDRGSKFSVSLIVEKSSKKEIGKELQGANILMVAKKDEFINTLSQDFMGLGVNFQNYSIINNDMSTALIQMIVSGKFYDMAIFDIDIFKNNTAYIAGTLKAINPKIKLLAFSEEDNDELFFEFDQVIHKPISSQRFVKEIDRIYFELFLAKKVVIDYSKLDILIVESIELHREYEKEMLNSFFCIACDTAVNGKEAIAKAKAKQYDAILMDMSMPVMDGVEATREIRKFDTQIPIICMSTSVYKEDKRLAQDAGMNDFIQKPLDKIDIENTLLKLVNKGFSTVEVMPSIPENLSGLDMRIIAKKHLEQNFQPEVANRLFAKALESIKVYIERIEKSFKHKDTASLIEDFHILKGVCSNIGLKEISNEAGRLQKLSEKGELLLIVLPTKMIVKNLKLLLDESH
ncbi:MAG: response regulator [Sulfurovum sp.]|nr:response regulator [Sulfurovum sp.]